MKKTFGRVIELSDVQKRNYRRFLGWFKQDWKSGRKSKKQVIGEIKGFTIGFFEGGKK